MNKCYKCEKAIDSKNTNSIVYSFVNSNGARSGCVAYCDECFKAMKPIINSLLDFIDGAEIFNEEVPENADIH